MDAGTFGYTVVSQVRLNDFDAVGSVILMVLDKWGKQPSGRGKPLPTPLRQGLTRHAKASHIPKGEASSAS